MSTFNRSNDSNNTLFTPGTELFKLSVLKSSNATPTYHLDYDENAWRDLDKAELSQPEINIDRDGRADG